MLISDPTSAHRVAGDAPASAGRRRRGGRAFVPTVNPGRAAVPTAIAPPEHQAMIALHKSNPALPRIVQLRPGDVSFYPVEEMPDRVPELKDVVDHPPLTSGTEESPGIKDAPLRRTSHVVTRKVATMLAAAEALGYTFAHGEGDVFVDTTNLSNPEVRLRDATLIPISEVDENVRRGWTESFLATQMRTSRHVSPGLPYRLVLGSLKEARDNTVDILSGVTDNRVGSQEFADGQLDRWVNALEAADEMSAKDQAWWEMKKKAKGRISCDLRNVLSTCCSNCPLVKRADEATPARIFTEARVEGVEEFMEIIRRPDFPGELIEAFAVDAGDLARNNGLEGGPELTFCREQNVA